MHRSVIDAIGNTPLIRLKTRLGRNRLRDPRQGRVHEPGQSVKDRAGLFIIRDAEAAGLLQPGGVIVEGTAGNTGIGLTLVAKALGYRTVIVIPDTQSQEKKDALRAARRRTDRSAGGAVQEPQQLRETVGPAGRAAGEDRAERRHLGQPVRQCRQPRRPYPHHGAGNLDADRRQGRRFRLGGGHGRHAGRRRCRAEGARSRLSRSRSPTRWGPRSTASTPGRAEVGGQFDHRRHRPGPHHRQS